MTALEEQPRKFTYGKGLRLHLRRKGTNKTLCGKDVTHATPVSDERPHHFYCGSCLGAR